MNTCYNPYDYISLNTWDEIDDNNIISIKFDKHTYCYEYNSLLMFLNEKDSVMADWVPRNLDVEIDSTGYGGMPGVFRFYKLPDGIHWITERSYRLLMFTDLRYFEANLITKNMPIGNVRGTFAISGLHGNNPQNIYDLDFVIL